MIEKQVQICSNCILPEGFLGIRLNSEKKCNFCCDSTYKSANWQGRIVTPEFKTKCYEEWNNIISSLKKIKNNNSYDCVLGFSGGKDSTALLNYLTNDIGLKVLALTVDMGFMPDLAKENVKKALNQLNYAHHYVLIEDAIPTFTKLYRYMFLNHESNDVLLSRKICDYCCDLLHSIVVKEAVKRSVPYVFFGYS
jgi:tRNA(Ile)-lysidine synthase TilS/MesJ